MGRTAVVPPQVVGESSGTMMMYASERLNGYDWRPNDV